MATLPGTVTENSMPLPGAMPPPERDLVGYGRTPPDLRWPDGARLAVSFVVTGTLLR